MIRISIDDYVLNHQSIKDKRCLEIIIRRVVQPEDTSGKSFMYSSDAEFEKAQIQDQIIL